MIRKITVTDAELQSLVGLIDAGVRATGLRAAQDAARLLSRIEAAEAFEEVPISGETPGQGE